MEKIISRKVLGCPGHLRMSSTISQNYMSDGRGGGHESNPAPINRKMTLSIGQGYNED